MQPTVLDHAESRPLRFGVNYTPSQGWFHSWLDFDPDAVRRDFDDIAGLGVDHVRIFALWPLVQPHRGLIRAAALADVRAVVEIAAEFELAVNVDALQGHLSSFDFVPAWLQSWHRRELFTDPDVVQALADYLEALAVSVADQRNLLGITLGNEVNQFAATRHPDRQQVTPDAVQAWLHQLIAATRQGISDSAAVVTHACDDAAWYDDRSPFRPEHVAGYGDLSVVHSWVFNGAAQTFGGLGDGSVRHAEYLLQLAAAWHVDDDRPLWLQEVGAPVNVVAARDVVSFIEQTIRNAAGVRGLWGITWWCSHDVSRELRDFPELEYDLGLFTTDRRPKRAARAFARMIGEVAQAGDPAASGAPAADEDPAALVLDDTDPTYRSSCSPGGAFHRAWLAEAAERGRGPAIVLRSRVGARTQHPERDLAHATDTQLRGM